MAAEWTAAACTIWRAWFWLSWYRWLGVEPMLFVALRLPCGVWAMMVRGREKRVMRLKRENLILS